MTTLERNVIKSRCLRTDFLCLVFFYFFLYALERSLGVKMGVLQAAHTQYTP